MFLITVLIWGTTWPVIKFQINEADSMVSIAYRFLIASIILLTYCKLKQFPFNFSKIQHLFLAAQGILLFGINYWFFYEAEKYISSGIVALIFSSIVPINMFFSYIFLDSIVTRKTYVGAIIGLIGISIVFFEDILNLKPTSNGLKGMFFSLIATIFASLGNIISVKIQDRKIPIIQSNAIAMAYGSIMMFVTSFILNKNFTIPITFSYMASLLYLSIIGSILAFNFYLTLLGRIGPTKAAYVNLVVPIFAILLSSIFENFEWTIFTSIGLFLICFGNKLAQE